MLNFQFYCLITHLTIVSLPLNAHPLLSQSFPKASNFAEFATLLSDFDHFLIFTLKYKVLLNILHRNAEGSADVFKV